MQEKLKTIKNLSKILAVLFFIIAILSVAYFNANVTASANMGPPTPIGENSGIVFEKHDIIQVDRQVLDIEFVAQREALIIARYTMTNTASETLTIQSMFLSPTYNNGDRVYTITANGRSLEYEAEFFSNYWESITYDDLLNWQDILTNKQTGAVRGYISAVVFDIVFEPNQTLDVVVQYSYIPNRTWQNANRVVLRYLLTPARYWKSYQDLTINLTLYEGHLFSSTLDFSRISRRIYQFQSLDLPENELRIVVSSMPRNFGFLMNGGVGLFFLSIFILAAIVAAFLFFVILFIKKRLQHKINTIGLVLWIIFFVFAAALFVMMALMFLMALLTNMGGWIILILGIPGTLLLGLSGIILIPTLTVHFSHRKKLSAR